MRNLTSLLVSSYLVFPAQGLSTLAHDHIIAGQLMFSWDCVWILPSFRVMLVMSVAVALELGHLRMIIENASQKLPQK